MATRIGVALAALVAALVIAACGSSSDSGSDDSGSTSSERNGRRPDRRRLGQARRASSTISNWPLYIDKQTIPDFEKETGVTVKYIEDVNDNAEFFGKVQPQLDQGESGGRSIFVVTDWMADEDARARLPAELRQDGDAEQRREHRPEPRPPAVRHQPRLLDAVADGDDRAGGAQGPGART